MRTLVAAELVTPRPRRGRCANRRGRSGTRRTWSGRGRGERRPWRRVLLRCKGAFDDAGPLAGHDCAARSVMAPSGAQREVRCRSCCARPWWRARRWPRFSGRSLPEVTPGTGMSESRRRASSAAPRAAIGRVPPPLPRLSRPAIPEAGCAAIPCAAPRRWPREVGGNRARWRGHGETGPRHRCRGVREVASRGTRQVRTAARVFAIVAEPKRGTYWSPRSIKWREARYWAKTGLRFLRGRAVSVEQKKSTDFL